MPEITPCEFGAERCRYSVQVVGEMRSKCTFCRLSPANEGAELPHYWRPEDKRLRHPQLVKEDREQQFKRMQERATERKNCDRGKKKVVRRAGRAEKATEQNIIHATRNSGRVNRDGDHVAAGFITLDTKLQSLREHPIVLMNELAKVREDAQRAGNPIGGLVLRNKHGIGVVVIAEKDFARILSRLTESGK